MSNSQAIGFIDVDVEGTHVVITATEKSLVAGQSVYIGKGGHAKFDKEMCRSAFEYWFLGEFDPGASSNYLSHQTEFDRYRFDNVNDLYRAFKAAAGLIPAAAEGQTDE